MSMHQTPESLRLSVPERVARQRGEEVDSSIRIMAAIVGAEAPQANVAEYGFRPSSSVEQPPIDTTAAQQVVDLKAYEAAKLQGQMAEPADVNQRAFYAQKAA